MVSRCQGVPILMQVMLPVIAWLWFAIAASAQPATWDEWADTANRSHPLAGKVVGADGKSLSFRNNRGPADHGGPGFAPLLSKGGVLLLGEVHDNASHHLLRSWIIARSLGGVKRKPAVVFEHIRANQQQALDALFPGRAGAQRMPTFDAVMQVLAWRDSGWPAAKLFEPLFDVALDAGLPMVAGDPPREQVRALARQGAGALSADERARLSLDAGLPAALRDALETELRGSHCGLLPAQAIGPMALAQRYRDAHQAAAALGAVAAHGSAVLLAGNGHVRKDRGTPWHIRQRSPATPVVSVMLIEVEDGKTNAMDYMPRDPDGRAAADMIIFTLRQPREDPCIGMRARFGKQK
ncbi:MAG: ChaN family lipoprotein [Hyphomicrobiaceae bacterium]